MMYSVGIILVLVLLALGITVEALWPWFPSFGVVCALTFIIGTLVRRD